MQINDDAQLMMTLTVQSPTVQPMNSPLVEELVPAPDVMSAVGALSHWPKLLLFDSALHREPLGRYSFLTADPIATWTLDTPRYGVDPFAPLRPVMDRIQSESRTDLPPFQGGIAGLMGYELGHCLERVAVAKHDEFQLPVLAAGLYDWVIAWDHRLGRAWLISHGWANPERDASEMKSIDAEEARLERAANRMTSVRQALIQPKSSSVRKNERSVSIASSEATSRVTPQVTPQPVRGLVGVTSNFSRKSYESAVARIIEYIRAGDIFQANLTQRLLAPATESPVELFARLRTVNPAPFAGLMQWDDWAVISASPERFLRVDHREVESRPIKGTRRRQRNPEADLFSGDELRESEKDQAENIMIVDLIRNDLSRVCEPGSIRVPQLCGVETYETVQHLVSEVRGRLREEAQVWDLFLATLPGGSISGAPKVRAMQIISELEPTARGPYCGSLFYVGANGQSDSNLLIRTFVQRHGWLQCGVGGGIVAQSNPSDEYEETLVKAAGMIRSLPDAG